jgi:hypothetical protein
MASSETTQGISGSVADASRGTDFYLHALLGAVVTVVASFVPFSPVLGGAVAGYVHDAGTGRGTQVGLVSGIIASLPLAGVVFVVFTVMSIGSLTTGEFTGPLFVVAVVTVILLFVALYTVGLSAAGGYLGATIAESRRETRAEDAAADRRSAAGTDPDGTATDHDDRE